MGCLYKVKADCMANSLVVHVTFFRAYKSVSVCTISDVG